MSARTPSPPREKGRDKSRIDDANASTAFTEDVRPGLWSWTKLDDTTAVGPRIGPVLQSVFIASSDSNDSLVSPERQHELEKGNAIQYRTCSWQKVCSSSTTDCNHQELPTDHQAEDCRAALFRVHLLGYHELSVVIQCLGSCSWVSRDPATWNPTRRNAAAHSSQINLNGGRMFGRALHVSIITVLRLMWLHMLIRT